LVGNDDEEENHVEAGLLAVSRSTCHHRPCDDTIKNENNMFNSIKIHYLTLNNSKLYFPAKNRAFSSEKHMLKNSLKYARHVTEMHARLHQ
jgi:hypothetical protein